MKEIVITTDNFQREVLESDKPIFVDFYADWCGPCRMLAPILAEIAEERDDVRVGKVNVDKEGALAEAFEINSIPAVLLFKNGKLYKASVGYRQKAQLLDMLK